MDIVRYGSKKKKINKDTGENTTRNQSFKCTKRVMMIRKKSKKKYKMRFVRSVRLLKLL